MDKLLVCELYQLARVNGAYDKTAKIPKPIRSRVLVTEADVDLNNNGIIDGVKVMPPYINSGKWYEVNEEATEQNRAEREAKRVAKANGKVLESNAVAEALKQLVTGASTKVKAKVEPQAEDKAEEVKPKAQKVKRDVVRKTKQDD